MTDDFVLVMATSSLPPSVQEMLSRICRDRGLDPPEPSVLHDLSALGEGPSLDILQSILDYPRTIRTLSGLMRFMMKKACSSGTDISSPSPQKCFSGRGPRSSEARLSPVSPSTLFVDEGSSSQSCKKAKTEMSTPHLEVLGELEFKKVFLTMNYIGKNKLEDVFSVNDIRSMKNLTLLVFEMKLWNIISEKRISSGVQRIRNLESNSKKVHVCHCHVALDGSFTFTNLESNSKKVHVYHCHVALDGSFTFKGPFFQNTRNHLQRALGDENILNVMFEDVEGDRRATNFADRNDLYHRVAKEGIPVGLRRYEFFVFKDGGKEEKKKSPTSSPVKCYFVCMHSSAAVDLQSPNILMGKRIQEARCLFMHAHTVSSTAKYMARFALILSKTIKLELDFGSVKIERIEDIPCLDGQGNITYIEDGEPFIHTDGTGFISEDLARKCPTNAVHGDVQAMLDQFDNVERCSTVVSQNSFNLAPPLLIQFRLFYNGCAVKGTLLINKKLPPRTIQIRPSMIKVETDPKVLNVQSINSFEIVQTSNQPGKAYLNKHLVMLLTYGGVPKDYFMDLLMNALDDVQKVKSNKRTAFRAALNSGEIDDFLVARMILCGIPLSEPYLEHRLSILMREDLKRLKKGKLYASDCYYLMGTADPTGMLKANEVCVILNNGQISGDVLVYKAPGLHFGDIHVLKAAYIKDLDDFVGNSKYAIFFPAKGPRSLADEMANSDFDGDMYWVSRNQQLLDFFKASEPWQRVSPKKKIQQIRPSDLSVADLEHDLFQRYLANRFEPSPCISTAADSWLSFMDRLLILEDRCVHEKKCLHEKLLKLVNIYYDALDAPKSGAKVEVPKELKAEKFPHYLERCNSYNSTSILGMIYDKVASFPEEYELPGEQLWELPCFSGDIPESCWTRWSAYYDEYRQEMTCAMNLDVEAKDSAANSVIQKYKMILYNQAQEFEESRRNTEEIYDDAVAIYRVCYNYAKTRGEASRCNFAWKVAGHALCKLYALRQNEKSIVCLPSVLRELL